MTPDTLEQLRKAGAAPTGAARTGDDRRSATGPFVVTLIAMFALTYVSSASGLSVLNQASTIYARKYDAPVGTVVGISRSIFSTIFGVAPVATIALHGVHAALPLGVLAGCFACAAGKAAAQAGATACKSSNMVRPRSRSCFGRATSRRLKPST